MTITDVKIRHVFSDPNQKLKAIVSIVIDDAFAVHDLKIIKGVERMFVAMPNRKSGDGRYQDIVHPISSEARAQIEHAVLSEFEKHLRMEAIAS